MFTCRFEGKWKDQATNLPWSGWELRRTNEWAKFFKDLSPKLKVHFVSFYRRENSVLNWKCQVDVKFKQKFYEWRSDNFERGLYVFVWVKDTWHWNWSANFSWLPKHVGFQINFSKNSRFIILFMFIHNSSSNNGRKTSASKLLTHRFSAGCVGGFLAIFTFSSISLRKVRDEAS